MVSQAVHLYMGQKYEQQIHLWPIMAQYIKGKYKG